MRQANRISLTALAIIGLGCAAGCRHSRTTRNASPNRSEDTSYQMPAPQVQFNDKQFNPHSDVTPSARGCSNETSIYLAGSFIYWKSGYSDMIISSRLQNSLLPQNQKQKKISLNNQYDPGFKVGLGCNFQRDVWDLFLNWTRLESNVTNRAHTHTPKLVTLLGSLVASGQNDTFVGTHLKANWDFHFNSVDLELGRNFYIGKYLSLRPYAGAKGAWIKQDLKVSYKGAVEGVQGTPFLEPITGHYKDHMWGVGPRIGLNSRWVLGKCNIAFLADLAGSLIWEDFQPYSRVHFVNPLTGNGPFIERITGHQTQLNPIAEVFVGFDWGHCFDERVYFNLSAGYEMQYLWDQLKTTNFLSFQQNDALGMRGLTATLRMDF
ncbi:MAG: hypothetical protein HYZ48_05145 [Chlamydiales bacterium]|nr:hypothetical protein [Chlamydiales bacterium]